MQFLHPTKLLTQRWIPMAKTVFADTLSTGDILGNGFVFVSRDKNRITANGQVEYRGIFICPACNQNFSAAIKEIKRKRTRSCGCIMNTKGGKSVSQKQLYHVWYNMIARCENPNHQYYANYGGRGVTVSSRWKGESGFENFLLDMSPTYKPGLQLDKDIRFEGNLIYSRLTCMWVTPKQNQAKLSTTRICWLEGKRMTLQEAANALGLPYRNRVKKWAVSGVPKQYQHLLEIEEKNNDD
jgi:transcription elongation factor Elf1